MGWGSWIARIGGYVAAPFTGGASIALGEGIAQGLDKHGAIKKANQQQQQATDAANRVAGDVYQQQRADVNNLYGTPYRTLGSLMGLDIAPIGPAANVPTNAVAPGPPGLVPGTVQIPRPTVPGAPNPGAIPPAPPGAMLPPQTLADLHRIGRGRQSTSGYRRGTATARG